MRLVRFALFAFFLAPAAFAENLVLINGSLIDGTGKPRALGNLRIRDGKITDMGVFRPTPGEMTLDVKGMVVAPGFIDFLSLSPAAIQKDPAPGALIMQGVTTAVLGADGTGPYSIEEFMLPFDEKPTALNIAMLVGHATVRRQILGSDYKRAATADELQRMSELVSDGMKQGAFGLGTDLKQEPASFSSLEELATLAKVVARIGGSILMNPRDTKEAGALARDAKISVIDTSAESYSYAQLAKEKPITLEKSIQRLSGGIASRVGLAERGVLKKGMPADIVVLNPQGLSAGPKYVFVNGVMVAKEGQPTDARPGQALR